VGRTAELAELDRQLELAEAGHERLVLLAGPAGIGKTALIRRGLSVWGARADPVLASGDPDEAALSGGLLSQLAQPGARAAAEIAALLADGGTDPLSVGPVLLAFLHELACTRTLIVVIDDAQWADELSLKALSFALRRLITDPVLCVIVSRPEDQLQLPLGITRLADDYGVRLDLGGLKVDEVAELAGLAGVGQLPARSAQRLRDHTAGVPLHIRELLHDLPAEALRTPGITLPAPRSLGTLVLSRLATCAVDTERLVVAAAILGAECELADAAAVAGLADPLPALQEAIEQRLLSERETTGPRRCAFPHALIRTAIYRDIGVSRRATLHRTAAELLDGCAALAHRVAGCRGRDPELAADLVAQAASEQAAGQLAEAADHLLMAVQAANRGASRDQWLITAVGMLIDLGDAAGARTYTGEITALPPSAQRSLLLGRLAMLNGAYAPAEQWITAAWAALEIDTGPEPEHVRGNAARTACQMALMLIAQHRLDEAATWAQRAADTAVSGFSRACACAVHGGSLAAAGHTGQARTLLEAELGKCADGPGRALLHAGLGATLLYADDLPGAARHLDAATTTSGSASLPMAHLLEVGLLRVVVCYRNANWDQAAAEAERLVGLIDDLDQGWLLARAHLVAVYVAAGRGQWPSAASHAEAAARQSAAQAGAGAIALADARTAIAVARDDPEGILAAAQDAVSDPDLLSRLEPSRLSFWPAYAQALARTGRQGDADVTLRRYEQHASACGRRSAMAAASRARGILEATRKRPDDALAAFDASLRHLDGLGMLMDEAMTRLERGRLLRRLGQRRSATRELSTARTVFAGLAAQPFVLRCDKELCADVQAVTGLAQPPLTARQLSVAQAAAAGKSNREIAAELYISVKTVEFHLGQILARLGLDSRTQIAASLADGLANPVPGGFGRGGGTQLDFVGHDQKPASP
jgi:DNA-binding CsgD family transcriptional regulator